jgi:hypothetical protein
VHSFCVADGTTSLRHRVDTAHISLMTGVLTIAQQEGELAAWVDPQAIASALYAQYMSSVLRWASGELSDEQFPPTAKYGLCLILLGLARGEAARKLERLARECQKGATPSKAAARKGQKS